VALVLAASLAACSATNGGAARIKCPACGYEFDTPAK
jgi:hypothetical protein